MPQPTPPVSSSRGFSLATVFLVTAVLAVLLALVGSSIRESRLRENSFVSSRITAELAGVWVFFSTLFSGVGGLVAGVMQPRRLRGALVGSCAGALFGMSIGGLIVQPPRPGVILGGCAVLVLTGLALRVLVPPRRRLL